MPCQIDLVVPRVRRIHRFHIIRYRHRLHRGLFAQPLILHIADKSAFGLDLAPVLHLLQNSDFRPLRHIRQDIALDAALITHLRVFEYCRRLSWVPFRIDLHPVRIRVQSIGKIRILLHKIRRHIQHVSFVSGDDIVPRAAVCTHRHRLLTDQRTDDGIRQRIEQKSFLRIQKKSVIKIFMHGRKIKIAYAVYQPRMFLDPLILQDNGHVALSPDLKIFRQICPLFGI